MIHVQEDDEQFQYVPWNLPNVGKYFPTRKKE